MTKKNRILIVDDDKTSLMVLLDILQQQDYSLNIAKKGTEALKNAAKYMPDLILLDILLPDMDGYEVLAQLQKDDSTKKIPVIFISGLNESGSREKGLNLGAVDYITKPFSPSDIKIKVMRELQIINRQQD